MPFKFWKRDKSEGEKGKPGEGPKEGKAEAAEKGPKPGETPAPGVSTPGGEAAASVAPALAAPPAPSQEALDVVVSEAHAGLVDLGLTIPATKAVFVKRVGAYPGGEAAFVETYRAAPYRAATRLLAEWLGFRAPSDFVAEEFLKEMNLRLSSFKVNIRMTDLTWLDEELGLRKARIGLENQEKVVRFKDARDFVKGVNELLVPKKVCFVELETWTNQFAFMLVRDPKWDKLAATNLVVVKAPQTAVGGECGECGAPVGSNWHDCLSCGAVFGTD